MSTPSSAASPAPSSSSSSSCCLLPLSCHLPVLDRSIKFYKLLIRLGVCVCVCVDPYYITRCVYTLWAHAPLLVCLLSPLFVFVFVFMLLLLMFTFLIFLLVFCFVVFAYAALFTLLYLLFRYSTTFFHIEHAESSRLQFNLPPHFPDSDSDFDFDIDMSCLESSASLFPPSRFPRFDFLCFFFISAFFGEYPLIVAVFSTFFSRCSFCGLIVPVVPVPAADTREHP